MNARYADIVYVNINFGTRIEAIPRTYLAYILDRGMLPTTSCNVGGRSASSDWIWGDQMCLEGAR